MFKAWAQTHALAFIRLHRTHTQTHMEYDKSAFRMHSTHSLNVAAVAVLFSVLYELCRCATVVIAAAVTANAHQILDTKLCVWWRINRLKYHAPSHSRIMWRRWFYCFCCWKHNINLHVGAVVVVLFSLSLFFFMNWRCKNRQIIHKRAVSHQ